MSALLNECTLVSRLSFFLNDFSFSYLCRGIYEKIYWLLASLMSVSQVLKWQLKRRPAYVALAGAILSLMKPIELRMRIRSFQKQ
jgi:hypothetical protein